MFISNPLEITLLLFLALSPTVFALVDLHKRDLAPNQKAFWTIFILVFFLLGALIYGLYRYPYKSENQ